MRPALTLQRAGAPATHLIRKRLQVRAPAGRPGETRSRSVKSVPDDVRYYENVLQLVGNTPLVRLRSVARECRCPVLAKLEFFNPGGSVKDRIGLSMVEAAERE